jgi:hypothetical protein
MGRQFVCFPDPGIRCGHHERLDFDSFRNSQHFFKFNTQKPDSTVHLRMPQQKLNSAQDARLLINLGNLCASH